VRKLFTRENILNSAWYRARLKEKQTRDIALWTRHVSYLRVFLSKASHAEPAERLHLRERLKRALARLNEVEHPDYIEHLWGTLGADPVHSGEGPVLVGAEKEQRTLAGR
jgi:hypothetical protein